MHEILTVGFDIGGTNLRAGVVDHEGHIIDAVATPVPRSPETLVRGIIQAVEHLKSSHDIAAVGLAVAGFLDPECEIVRFAPHLSWRDYPAKRELEKALRLPVRLEHDANSAAWGENQFGAARGVDNWVLFALGTGIGATLMDRNTIYRGAFGTAPEFGHLTVVPDGRACACGKKGCLERYCSGSALEETAREYLNHPHHLPTALTHKTISGRHIMHLAREGDPLATEVLKDFTIWLGKGLSIVGDVLDPGLILLGGGVSQDADLYLATAKTIMAENLVGAGHRPVAEVKCAELGADAGMIGVADLARRYVNPSLTD
ncbi:ROK family protein [Corynebacterium sp. ES2730-CONJ]|uniref:ROK family protein n=1 Tax=Corynebacterium sp. ES2730-CONJ TaxID=2973941 RepID=UPI00216B1FFF|nr:ROK family protein [Corynebacterium sp. ES2730-CONJ]MCS4531311.1 ROK family protein [Corynebacterium sp. ES2730-CONJ]